MHLLTLLSKAPLSALYSASNIAAFLLFHVFRYRRTISLNNLKNAFPEKNQQEIVRIQKASYLYLTDCFFESIKAYSLKKSEVVKRVTMHQQEEIKTTLKQGRSALILAAHTGCGEWMSQCASINLETYIDPVYKPAHSKWIDRFIFAARSRLNSSPIPYKNVAKDIQRRKNVVRCIGLFADLSPRRREQAITVEFLNQPTRFFQSAERVAKLANVPIYFADTRRRKRGYYEITMHKLCESPKNVDENEITLQYAKRIEQTIIAKPEAWLWTHRRWKHPTN